MPIKIGILQGRLSRPSKSEIIQEFPIMNWKNEFQLAVKLGFEVIELIFDGPENPLFNSNELMNIKELAEKNKIPISSVNSDYSMFCPLFGKTKDKTVEITEKLILNCHSIEIPRVGISFEDNSAILTASHVAEAIESVKKLIKLIEKNNMILTMETSLGVNNVKEFIARVGSDRLKVNFDLGNSCCLGEDSPTTIKSLGGLIGGVHIKDRVRLFGGTVPLGNGNVDFGKCIQAIKEIGYNGTFIIQGARGKDDLETAKSYLNFVRGFL